MAYCEETDPSQNVAEGVLTLDRGCLLDEGGWYQVPKVDWIGPSNCKGFATFLNTIDMVGTELKQQAKVSRL
ncbi:MAG TPA: hypothetical protein VKP65_03270, partial [Rhodothermales bacterium]|nr:hypothetical protein [Rhodothermales bacterium]